jgi:hypothetical protein
MREIDSLRQRLEAAPSAGGLAGTLEASWDAFDLLLAACHACADRASGPFAAFTFASSAAAEGRFLLWAAPSLPTSCGRHATPRVSVKDDLESVADELADLAGMLSERLSAAARTARDPGDRGACADAADRAGQARWLLGRDP